MTAKKCTKKRDERAEFVLPIQPIPCFLPFSLSSLSWDLEVPNTRTTENGALMKKRGYSAVARLDLFAGGNHERRRRELQGGILPRKVLNYRVSEIAFSAFGEH